MNRYLNIYVKYCLIIIGFGFVFAQSSPSDIKILSITFEGNNRFDDQDVSRHLRLYPGMSISGEDIQEIIKRAWKKNIYKNIQIYIQSETSEGINLLVQVEEFPILNDIKFSGNSRHVIKPAAPAPIITTSQEKCGIEVEN